MHVDNQTERRDIFHKKIRSYINGMHQDKTIMNLLLCPRRVAFERNAIRLAEEYRQFAQTISRGQGQGITIMVYPYKGKNPFALKMIDYFDKDLKKDVIGVYLHGSLGTYEEIPYSDFDALVILKDDVFGSPQRLAYVAKKLYDAQSIMFDFDPLQHHGWFVLTQSQLRAYPNHYFPVELFSHAKSLFPDRGCELTISVATTPEQYRKPFWALSDGIISCIEKKRYPDNLYRLKSLLSQFMLLPALYVQARDGRGVFKKLSFEMTGRDFPSADWSVMDEVSLLREGWTYRMSPTRRKILSRPGTLSRLLAKRCGPSIPPKMRTELTEKFYGKMLKLAIRMRERLG